VADLTDLTSISGEELTEDQIRGILVQIDLDITNLVRDGKLSALKYWAPGEAGHRADRSVNLMALLEARKHYERLLEKLPGWSVSRGVSDCGE
jgi:hypothetical protein